MTRRALIPCLALAALAAPAAAQPFQFQYITGSLNPVGAVIPSGNQPAFDGLNIAFSGAPVGGFFNNIYKLSLGGQLTTIAVRGAPAPGGGTFDQLDFAPSIGNGCVAFHGFSTAGLGRGIYWSDGTTLRNVVGPGYTNLPGAAGPQYYFDPRPSVEGQLVSFSAGYQGGSALGIYSWTPSGGVRLVADFASPMPIPPVGPFVYLGVAPAVRNGQIALVGGGGPAGVFLASPTGVFTQTIMTTAMPVPGGGTFNGLGFATIAHDNGSVVFEAFGSFGDGLFTNLGGPLRRIADTSTPIPGGNGNFTSFQFGPTDLALSGNNILFLGVGSGGQKGIYGDFGAGLQRVVSVGSTLDGRTISDIYFSREGLRGDRFAFSAIFTDGSRAIYLATIPAPSGLVVAVVGGVIGIGRGRRRG